LSPGTRLGFHEIVAPIGAGGMGEVYRARDTRLGRDVALKVLPAEMASSPERLERFQREARVVAALNHPHIVTIHSVEESGGVHFLTMELVEGRSLDLLIAEGPLPVARLIEIATALADALAAAHERGIIHRDLKPANVMVGSGGRVKVLDFGLAKVEPAGGAAPDSTELPTEMKTQEGVVMGTVPYMSPEQVQGRAVDLRTDIFSLGIILYEMATGQRPFQGHSSAELVSSILRDTPRPLTELRADCPEGLARVIQRCLEKSPADRFPSAGEVRYGLRGVTSDAPLSRPATASVSRPRPAADSGAGGTDRGLWVAVLPFRHGGAEAELAALADGLSEEIATGLSRFRYLSVVSSTSAARLKGEAGDERALGARLGARYVLEGSLRRGGSDIRVSAQLVDTQTGAQLWSETYGRDLRTSSMFAVQDDVAARIVATVADSYGVLVHAMRSASRQKDDVDLTPVEWQFQYFAYREQITPSAYAELKERLERAVERDGRQSDLWACLAQIFVDEYAFGFGTDPAALDRALAAARRAVELDRANQFALVALAQTHFFRQDLAAFGPAAERAMALNPFNTDAVGILGLQIVHTGEFERGAAIVRRAMELNANHAGWMHFAPLWEHFHKEEYEQALERANRVDVPGLFWPYLVVASACGHLGRRAEAGAAVRDLLALDPGFAAHARSNVARWHFASGLLNPILEGLRKAGLEVPDEIGTAVPTRDPARSSAPRSGAALAEEGFWIAVRPFKCGSPDAALTTLAEGLTEGIVTGLSRFSYLRVVSRPSGDGTPGARYVIEGSLRQVGTRLRLAVQLVDTTSGAHLWAEDYERTFAPDAAFELQDDLVPRIVSTVADQYGALVHSMSESLRGRSSGDYSPHEAVLRAFGYWERVTREEHGEVRGILEAAVARAPGHSDCLAALSLIYAHEYVFGYNVQPDSLGRARAAAQRAVASAPTSSFAHCALAFGLFFLKDALAFRTAAERALSLNRMDSSTAALLGLMIAYADDWEYGLGVVERAKQLNPHHPGWYHYAALTDAYRKRDYRGALAIALKVNMPGYHWPYALLAAVYGQLGERQRASVALRELLALLPNFGAMAREEFGKWHDAELTEHLLDGLRKAGLEVPPEGGAAAPAPTDLARASATDSGAARADEGFWVAVLPFKHTGGDESLAAFAEGMTDEIVTGLSRFSYLRVLSRGSTSRSGGEADARTAGRELGARYVLDGNVRQAGSTLRVSVQLIEAESGAHLWAETYSRPFRADGTFELQDDLVSRIVATVGDPHGILPHTMSELLRSQVPGELSPYEAVLRSFGFGYRSTAEEHAAIRDVLEKAVRDAPRNADAWAMLSLVYAHEYAHEFNVRPDPLGRALDAARRAVSLAPSSALAYDALAWALFFRKEYAAFRAAADQALALNPLSSPTLAGLGTLTAYAGEWEKGCALVERAVQLNPRHPGWYRFALFANAYRQRDYRSAVDIALKLNLPDFFVTHEVLAAAYGQLGERDAAVKALKELLRLRPDYAETGREKLGKWFGPELVEQWMDGLRKAGLQVPPRARSESLPAVPHAAAVAIAVLPFSDMSEARDQDYLCEGMAEEIMNALVRIDGIRVASRTSAFRARRDLGDLPAIARALSVNHVLEGSVRTSGARLRVTAQLTDVTSGFQLWSERFDRDAADIFAVQDEIAAGVVEAVKARLAPGAPAIHARPPARNLEAYRSYLKGRHLRYAREDYGGAIRAFEEATRLDPTHAPSWTGLAESSAAAANMGAIPAREACAAARKALATAVELGGESADGLHAEAFVALIERRWDAMESAWRRAIDLQPAHVLALGSFGISLCIRQKQDEGFRLLERAREADPLASFPLMLTGWALLCGGRPQEARRYAEDALSFEKEDVSALLCSSMANVALGNVDEGIATAEHLVAMSHRKAALFLGVLGWAFAVAGRQGEARTVLWELRALPGTPNFVSEAWLLGALGERDAAFEALARAEAEYQAMLYYTGLPGFDSLRTDERFGALLRRLDLA